MHASSERINKLSVVVALSVLSACPVHERSRIHWLPNKLVGRIIPNEHRLPWPIDHRLSPLENISFDHFIFHQSVHCPTHRCRFFDCVQLVSGTRPVEMLRRHRRHPLQSLSVWLKGSNKLRMCSRNLEQ